MRRARRWWRHLGALSLAAVITFAQAADAERGRALYEGQLPLAALAPTPRSQACAACHRPSGMGNFEGGLVVPPIAGPMLFRPLDRDTARFFAASSRWRVRPAYDDASLARLLRTGVSPDGVTMHATMPRYAISDSDLADLSMHLRQLASGPPPGVDDDTLHLATITTPEVDASRREAMLTTLRRFAEQKNGQSRHESHRSAQSTRTREMVMYRKFRVWQIEHWALQGEPHTWAAQLDEWQSRRPVFAVVAGLGGAQWAPVDAFCARHRLPCLLPLVDAGGGARPGFYSLHYHAGIDADVELAARTLRARGLRTLELWSEPSDSPLATRVHDAFDRQGLRVVEAGAAAGVVSLLSPEAQAARLGGRRESRPVMWLPGTRALGQAQLAAVLPSMAKGWIVSPMRTGEALDRQLLRTRLWLQGQGLAGLPEDVVASTLQAATVLGEGLMHLDFGFTQDYLLELLEHGLENVIPWSPYARLAIGPDQRIASKGSWVGEVRAGSVDWAWTPQP